MISERSRASDPRGVKRGKQCANATGSVAAHASHVRGVEAPRGLTCEFSFDKKGRPTLCHVLDLSGSSQRIATAHTHSNGLPMDTSPRRRTVPDPLSGFCLFPPQPSATGLAPSSRPQAWASTNAAVKSGSSWSQKFRRSSTPRRCEALPAAPKPPHPGSGCAPRLPRRLVFDSSTAASS